MQKIKLSLNNNLFMTDTTLSRCNPSEEPERQGCPRWSPSGSWPELVTFEDKENLFPAGTESPSSDTCTGRHRPAFGRPRIPSEHRLLIRHFRLMMPDIVVFVIVWRVGEIWTYFSILFRIGFHFKQRCPTTFLRSQVVNGLDKGGLKDQ